VPRRHESRCSEITRLVGYHAHRMTSISLSDFRWLFFSSPDVTIAFCLRQCSRTANRVYRNLKDSTFWFWSIQIGNIIYRSSSLINLKGFYNLCGYSLPKYILYKRLGYKYAIVHVHLYNVSANWVLSVVGCLGI